MPSCLPRSAGWDQFGRGVETSGTDVALGRLQGGFQGCGNGQVAL